MTILLIDDDDDDRRLFCEAAKEVDEAIECLSVPGGKEALTLLRDGCQAVPDFIFLDLRMPGLSGEDVLKEIKSEARFADVPVIVYTTSRDVGESVKLKKLGATHFMSKPASPDEVYYLISFVLGEKW